MENANVYAIPLNQIRLFDALDRPGTNLKNIRSVTITRDPESDPTKPKSNEERTLWIPGEMVSAKDPAVNVFIRQHDVIDVKAK